MIFGWLTDPGWRNRLVSEFRNLRASSNYRELTLARIKDLVGAPNDTELVKAISDLVSDGTIRVAYRVISPSTKASIATYYSPLDIPDHLLDESTGEEIDVDPFINVEPVYSAMAPSA